MFATLRYSQGKEPIRVERQRFAHEVGRGRGPHHSACGNCRNKKLRCDGRTPSCGRCVEKSIKCQYGPRSDHRDANTQSEAQSGRRRAGSRKYTNPAEDAPNLAVHLANPEARESLDGQCTGSMSNSSPPVVIMDDWLMADFDAQSLRSLSEIMLPEMSTDVMQGCNDPQPYAGTDPYTTGPNQEAENYWNFNHTGSCDPSVITHKDLHPSFEAAAKDQPTQPTRNSYIQSQSQHQTNHNVSSAPLRHHLFAPAEVNEKDTLSSIKDCQCWKQVAKVLEMIELQGTPNDTLGQSSPKSVLSFQRSAVEKCTMMIGCSHCRSSSERMMVLALILDKLVGQFEDLKKKYHQGLALQTNPCPNSSPRHGLGSPTPIDTPPADSRTGSYFDRPTSAGRRFFLGDYEIYPSEWMPLWRTLIDLYARSLEDLIVRCKSWATVTDLSVIPAMFIRVERRFRAMSVANDSHCVPTGTGLSYGV